MEKFTREYAEKLAECNLIQQPDLFNRRKIFSNGYMKAIEETNAPELLEALKDMLARTERDYPVLYNSGYDHLIEKAKDAINKATL